MTELAELIEDFRLETQFRDDYVYHVYNECDPEAGQRVLKRREYWKRDKHLGSGGFGSVWLEVCVDGHQKGRKRAVKDIQCPRGRVNYTRELEAIARFSKGLCARWYCQSFGWYEREDKIHLTMEYFPLGDLQSYVIRLSEPLPEADVQEISRQVFEGLDFMHKRNFAHRDIKPGVCTVSIVSMQVMYNVNVGRTFFYSLIHHMSGGSRSAILVSASGFETA